MRGARHWIAAAGLLTLIAPAARAQVAFSPQVSAFPNGVIMSATPAVSYDRRYVRLGMLPQFTVIEGFDTFSVPGAVAGLGAGGGGGGGLGGAGGAGGLVGFAGMNGPIGGPMQQTGFASEAGNPRGRLGASSDFEDQLQPVAPPQPARQAAARPAPKSKAKRKVATRSARVSTSTRPAAKGARAR